MESSSSSTINEPHPDDEGDERDEAAEAEAFFGGDEPAEHDEGEQAVVEASTEKAVEDPPPQSAPSAKPDPEPEPEPAKTGSTEREYIVFQRVPLTEKVLKHLLAAIEKGDAPTPRPAYFELHRATTRNDRQAIAEAYGENRDALGERCQLAAVSSRSFKERTVAPRIPVQRTDISIS